MPNCAGRAVCLANIGRAAEGVAVGPRFFDISSVKAPDGADHCVDDGEDDKDDNGSNDPHELIVRRGLVAGAGK